MLTKAFAVSALIAVVHGQGRLISAVGDKGSNTSISLQLDQTNTNDANVINTTEIGLNMVNECGRTLLLGNIDIGANTEVELSKGRLTSVTKGSTVTVKIQQGGAEGAGPYTCDLDPTSNSQGAAGQTKLDVKETDGQDGTITLAVTMPKDLACVGASTGNVCTMRCFNAAPTGPFGGCVSFIQTDVTPTANTPANIPTAAGIKAFSKQILDNNNVLPQTLQAVATTKGNDSDIGLALAKALVAAENTGTKVEVKRGLKWGRRILADRMAVPEDENVN